MARDERLQRLRTALLAMPDEPVRAAIPRVFREEVIRALPAQARPLANQLKRAPTPLDLLRKVPSAQLVLVLADDLTEEPLAATRGALGDAADDPTMEQLVAALDRVLEHVDLPTIRLMLASVAIGEAEAADLCDQLLTTDERFALPVEEAAAPSRASKPAIADDEIKARRRERKEAERERKAKERAKAAAPTKRKEKAGAPAPTSSTDDASPAPAATRRRPTDVPAGFDADDPLVGSVVLATVPFDDEIGAKTRPCVVVAASDDELLVRPGYSEGGVQSTRWQSHEVRDLAAAGCAKPTWIEAEARRVNRSDVDQTIGRLGDEDWNALW